MEKHQLWTPSEIRNFQVKRQIIGLYKTILIMFEDLEEEHIQHFNKLYETFKEQADVIRQADYLTKEKVSYLRKKVLDAGNDCIRSITGEENGKGEKGREEGRN